MNNLMKVAIVLVVVGILLAGVLGVFEFQNATARLESQRMHTSIPTAPHHRAQSFVLAVSAMLCSALGVAMARSAVKKEKS